VARRELPLRVLYVTGPGHGAPGLLADTRLEGTYSELDPELLRDEEGMRRLFRQYCFVEGNGPQTLHPILAETLDAALDEIRAIPWRRCRSSARSSPRFEYAS